MEKTVDAIIDSVEPFDDMDLPTANRLVIGEVMDRINYCFNGDAVASKISSSLKKHF